MTDHTLTKHQPEDITDDGVSIRWVAAATIICVVMIIVAHALLYIAFRYNWTRTEDQIPIIWQPIIGGTLGIISLSSFGMFYAASRRARVAITASFILTFLASLTFVLTVPAFAGETTKQAALGIFGDFRSLLTTIVIAYFGSEGLISATKAISTAVANRGQSAEVTTLAIRGADIDLPRNPKKPV